MGIYYNPEFNSNNVIGIKIPENADVTNKMCLVSHFFNGSLLKKTGYFLVKNVDVLSSAEFKEGTKLLAEIIDPILLVPENIYINGADNDNPLRYSYNLPIDLDYLLELDGDICIENIFSLPHANENKDIIRINGEVFLNEYKEKISKITTHQK